MSDSGRDPSQRHRTARGSDELFVAEPPRVRDRVWARWSSRRLDRSLADGTPPESAAALALRARRLTALQNRRSLASALERVVRPDRKGAGPSHVRIAPSRARVDAAKDELRRLADALSEPGPVAVRGVAQATILLSDGTGALYNPDSPAGLRAGVVSATENLKTRLT